MVSDEVMSCQKNFVYAVKVEHRRLMPVQLKPFLQHKTSRRCLVLLAGQQCLDCTGLGQFCLPRHA